MPSALNTSDGAGAMLRRLSALQTTSWRPTGVTLYSTAGPPTRARPAGPHPVAASAQSGAASTAQHRRGLEVRMVRARQPTRHKEAGPSIRLNSSLQILSFGRLNRLSEGRQLSGFLTVIVLGYQDSNLTCRIC